LFISCDYFVEMMLTALCLKKGPTSIPISVSDFRKKLIADPGTAASILCRARSIYRTPNQWNGSSSLFLAMGRRQGKYSSVALAGRGQRHIGHSGVLSRQTPGGLIVTRQVDDGSASHIQYPLLRSTCCVNRSPAIALRMFAAMLTTAIFGIDVAAACAVTSIWG
jgi:hypothetical protein